MYFEFKNIFEILSSEASLFSLTSSPPPSSLMFIDSGCGTDKVCCRILKKKCGNKLKNKNTYCDQFQRLCGVSLALVQILLWFKIMNGVRYVECLTTYIE